MADLSYKRVAVVTGPTGGHFFPGLALGERLRGDYGASLQFFVPGRRYILSWLEKKNMPYEVIPETPLRPKDPLFLFRLTSSVKRAFSLLHGKGFNAVVLTGSYTTAPFLAAARLLGIKVFVHEQNYLPGKVTLLSNYMADKIALTYPNFRRMSECKTILTGFPLLSDFTAGRDTAGLLRELDFNGSGHVLLVIGGSQGASFINRLVVDNIPYFLSRDIRIIHIAGRGEGDWVRKRYLEEGVGAVVFDFCFDMAALYNVADLAICRGGGGTMAEINYWGIAALVIPYPHAGFHQKQNVSFFQRAGACIMLDQKNAENAAFPSMFDGFLAGSREIKEKMKGLTVFDVGGKTAEAVAELIKN